MLSTDLSAFYQTVLPKNATVQDHTKYHAKALPPYGNQAPFVKKSKFVRIGGHVPTMRTQPGKFCGKLCARSKAASARFTANFVEWIPKRGNRRGRHRRARLLPLLQRVEKLDTRRARPPCGGRALRVIYALLVVNRAFAEWLSTCRPCRRQPGQPGPGVPAGQPQGSRWSAPWRQRSRRSPARNG